MRYIGLQVPHKIEPHDRKEDIKMPKLEIPFAAANGGIDYAILTGKRPVFQFSDGKRISDIQYATTITAALQGNSFSTLNIKIEGETELLPGVEDSEIKAACAAMKPMLVRFKDGKVSIYNIDGQIHLSGTATAVELITSVK